jgi:hypothetical protein
VQDLTALEASTQLQAILRATWAAHSDFAGVQIDAPRLIDVPPQSAGAKRISISINELSVREVATEAPKAWIVDATLSVYCLVESPYPETDTSGDPAAAVLGVLNPLAITTEKRLGSDLRAIREVDPKTFLSCQFYDFNFASYSAGVDDNGQRLQALGLFEYQLGFFIPEYIDTEDYFRLLETNIDWNLYGGIGDTIFPEEPHAEDDHTIVIAAPPAPGPTGP